MPKEKAEVLVNLYHRTGVKMSYGVGGPDMPLRVPQEVADMYIDSDPKIWSLKPFVIDSKPVKESNNGE